MYPKLSSMYLRGTMAAHRVQVLALRALNFESAHM